MQLPCAFFCVQLHDCILAIGILYRTTCNHDPKGQSSCQIHVSQLIWVTNRNHPTESNPLSLQCHTVLHVHIINSNTQFGPGVLYPPCIYLWPLKRNASDQMSLAEGLNTSGATGRYQIIRRTQFNIGCRVISRTSNLNLQNLYKVSSAA